MSSTSDGSTSLTVSMLIVAVIALVSLQFTPASHMRTAGRQA
jgi:hypothetical protein